MTLRERLVRLFGRRRLTALERAQIVYQQAVGQYVREWAMPVRDYTMLRLRSDQMKQALEHLREVALARKP